MNITAMNNYRAFYIWEYIVGIPPLHSCIPPFQHLSCSASLLYPEPYFPASLLSWIPLVLHPMLSCFPSPESHLSGIPTFLLWIFFWKSTDQSGCRNWWVKTRLRESELPGAGDFGWSRSRFFVCSRLQLLLLLLLYCKICYFYKNLR